jgi:hypothetical protein
MRKLLLLAFLAAAPFAHAAGEAITVYKSASCGCCGGWIEHMRAAGYRVKAVDLDAAGMEKVKQTYKVPEGLGSCHTAVVDKTGQVIEGHVPAKAVAKLLASPRTKGVAAPGMPMNSPGMGQMDGKLVTVDFNGKPFSKD